MRVRERGFRERVFTFFEGESLTDVSQQMHSDVNYIVQRFARTGSWPQPRNGVYADVTGLQRDLGERIQFVESVKSQVELALAQQAEAAKAADAAPPDPSDNPAVS